jgi:hypothetical protein
MTDRLLALMDWYNLDLIAFHCTTGTTTGTKPSLDLPTDGSVIRSSPARGPAEKGPQIQSAGSSIASRLAW